MPQEPNSTVIEHHSKHVFIVTPPAGILEQPDQVEAVKDFLDAVSAAATQYRTDHDESAVMVIDLAENPTLNSTTLSNLSDLGKRLSFEHHKVVLAKSPVVLSRLLNRIDPEKLSLEFDKRPAAQVAEERATQPPPNEIPKDKDPAPTSITIPVGTPPAPPPKPEWKKEVFGNAIVIAPPEGTKLNEVSQGKAFAERILELLPDPATLAHDAKPRVILDLANVVSLTGDSVGGLMQIPKKLKERSIELDTINLGEEQMAPLKMMKIDRMFNFSQKPLNELVERANQKGGATVY